MQESFSDINGCSLFTISNKKVSEVSVLVIHGYAEHIKRYELFYNKLDEQGYNVLGYDHRGHGQSKGGRAIIDSFDVYVEDMHSIIQTFFAKGKKNFIFAHSMGGLILLLYLQKYGSDNISGVITSGAALQMYESTPAILEKLAGPLSRLLPNLPTVPVKPKVVSRDERIVKDYMTDPLNYTKPTKAKMGYEFLKAQRIAAKNLSKINVPISINHGGSDLLIHPNSAQVIFDEIQSSDKTLKFWEGLYHEILNEPEKEEVAEEIINWIKAHA
jgi:alpha-beta hydrolase superfamily lysophospholipase